MVTNVRRFASLPLICLVFCQSLSAAWNFSSRESRVRLGETNSQLILSTAITGWDGTLEIEGLSADKVQGSTVTFDQGMLESNDMHAFVSFKYDPTTTPYDKITMEGSDRIRAEIGTILQDVEIQSTENSIEGDAIFVTPIKFTADESQVWFNLRNELNRNFDFNGQADCVMTLSSDLYLDGGVKILNSGANVLATVDINGHSLFLPDRVDAAWTTSLSFYHSNDIQLRAKTVLESEWWFKGVGTNNEESRINGHGEILDMSSVNAIIKVGNAWQTSTPTVHKLYITDCYIKGISDLTGTFSMLSPDAEVILNNVTLGLAGDYHFDHGKIKVEGDNCTVITSSYMLTFTYNQADTVAGGQAIDSGDPTFPWQTPTDVHKIKGQLTIDGVTLYYDTIGQADAHNIRPFAEEVWVVGGEHFHSDNGGLVAYKGGGGGGQSYLIDTPTYSASSNMYLGPGSLMTFSYAGTTAFNGNGFYIQFPVPFSSTGPVIINSGTHVEFTNTVFKDFDPSYITTSGTGTFKFGDGCRIELATNCDLNQTWSFIGNATIDGQGAQLNINSIPNGIVIDRDKTVIFEEIRLSGIQNPLDQSDRGALNLIGENSIAQFRNSQILLTGNYTFSEGKMKFYEDVDILGLGHIFTYSSRSQSTIEADARLTIDRGVTFSYEADLRLTSDNWDSTTYVASRNRLKLNDASATLRLNGCTLWSTHTGLCLDVGHLIVDDKVLLKSVAAIEEGIPNPGPWEVKATGEEAEFKNNLTIEVLAAATLDVDGHLKYE